MTFKPMDTPSLLVQSIGGIGRRCLFIADQSHNILIGIENFAGWSPKTQNREIRYKHLIYLFFESLLLCISQYVGDK